MGNGADIQLTQHTDSVWTLSNFLTHAECEALIDFGERRGFEEATVGLPTGARMMKTVRNNDRNIYDDPSLAQSFWDRLKPWCPAAFEPGVTSTGLNERFRFYRYQSEQRFKRHIDGRFKREGEESRVTFMIYLNNDYTGGETAFDDVTIAPEQGMALCFIHELKHEGCPVTTGTKYVLRSDVMYRLPA